MSVEPSSEMFPELRRSDINHPNATELELFLNGGATTMTLLVELRLFGTKYPFWEILLRLSMHLRSFTQDFDSVIETDVLDR